MKRRIFFTLLSQDDIPGALQVRSVEAMHAYDKSNETLLSFSQMLLLPLRSTIQRHHGMMTKTQSLNFNDMRAPGAAE